MSNGGRGELKHRPETIWRLVEAHCKQITDALTAARVPLVLALTWAFIWAWALYSVSVGYVHTFHQQSGKLLRMSKSADSAKVEEFKRLCLRHLKLMAPEDAELQARNVPTNEEFERCIKSMEENVAWAGKQRAESYLISFPGGLAKITVTDVAVIGQLGLILILAWVYFSTRREYQAVKAMVDLREDPAAAPGRLARMRRLLSLDWGPKAFVLVPGERHLSAEHLAYAYHSVAQRFLFILTDEARPLPRRTIVLLFFPALVAIANLGTDIWDLYRYQGALAPSAYRLVIAEFALLAGLTLPLTVAIASLASSTAALLHGWRLAVRDVWMAQWDERNEDCAMPVYVDTTPDTPVVRALVDERRADFGLEARPAWA